MKKKVIIVEDELLIGADIRTVIEKNGLEVCKIAKCYDTALTAIKESKPDVVVIDINLQKKLNGIDIAKEIKRNHKIPFVFLSAHFDDDTFQKAKLTGPCCFLGKPFNDHDLMNAINLAIENYSRNLRKPKKVISKLENTNSFFVKNQHAYERIEISNLLFIKGEGSYTNIQLRNRKIVLRAALKDFLFLEEHESIFKVHRSYLININHVKKIYSKYVEIEDLEIPISKDRKKEFLDNLHKVR